MVSVTTWNINSVRLRMPIVGKFLREHAPDVLCLQEIKCQEDQFPYDAFRELGYEHFAVHGQKGYHGVATVGKVPFKEFSRHDWQDNGEARHVGVELTEGPAKGTLIENVYVPAGGDIPDREQNPKFGQKLDFLERMTRWADKVDRPSLIVGDFNIAPLESDVWNHKQLLKVVSHTPLEVETLPALHGRAWLVRYRARAYTGAGTLLFLVELPVQGLAQGRSRAPARPYVGQPRTGGAGDRRTAYSRMRATGKSRATTSR